MADERAVSEVIGFVLVAGLILSTIGVVYVAGMGGLESARDAERIENAERAFDVLADNVNDLRARGAPSRATEVKLADASLTYGEPTTFFVNVTRTSDDSLVTNTTKTTDPIVYSTGAGESLVYDNGAVIRVGRDGAVLKNQPQFVFLNDGGTRTGIVPLLQTRQTGVGSVSGSSTVLIRSDAAIREVLISEQGPAAYRVNLTLMTTPKQAQVWADYLNRSSTIPDSLHADGDTTCDLVAGRVTCELELDRVTVTRTGVDVRYT